jgi:predicted MFS family arabinose efflux permease
MQLRNYVLVTAGYWAFTITDGALRMLVLLHFHELGYSPVAIAFLFLSYEFMGVLTNLLGGWVGARTGLNRTLIVGLVLQIVALVALTFQQPEWEQWVSVVFVMAAKALSGIAKDLTKMSSKSAVKFVAGDGEGALFKMVAILTGSKNALKGVGFFVGAALLAWIGYDAALWSMAVALTVTVVAVGVLLNEDIGKSKKKPPLKSILSKSEAVNRLAAARVFLFASRDIWFVVALPIFLDTELGWSYYGIGGFLAAWVIGYGMVQSVAPRFVRRGGDQEVAAARRWALVLGVVTASIATAVTFDVATTVAIVGGLVVFGVVFALNSSLHSYLILAYADSDEVSLDVGFYYSANAVGRLTGTLLSGLLYLWGGLEVALWGSTAFVVITWLLSLGLPAPGADADADPASASPTDTATLGR